MKSKFIGLTGSSGVLGKFITKNFKGYKFDCFKGDIKSKSDIKRWLKNKKFEGIFHLAAIVPTLKVKNNLEKAIATNYYGTKILVDEIIKNKNTNWILFTSTSHVYSYCKSKVKETIKTNPLSKYGMTKLKAEKYIISKKNKINFCIVRIFSYSYPGQKKYFFIPSVYSKFKKERLPVFENINHERDFVDIRDITRGIKILFSKKRRGIYNIGSGKKIPLIKIVNYFSKKFKKNFKLNNIVTKTTTQIANNEKLVKLGWRPKYEIFSVLKKF